MGRTCVAHSDQTFRNGSFLITVTGVAYGVHEIGIDAAAKSRGASAYTPKDGQFIVFYAKATRVGFGQASMPSTSSTMTDATGKKYTAAGPYAGALGQGFDENQLPGTTRGEGASPTGGQVITRRRRVAGHRVRGDEARRRRVPDPVVLEYTTRGRAVLLLHDIAERRRPVEGGFVDHRVEVTDRQLVDCSPGLVGDRGHCCNLWRGRRGSAIDCPRRVALDLRKARVVDEDASVDGRIPGDVRDTTLAAHNASH
jgi:hypothetical protein